MSERGLIGNYALQHPRSFAQVLARFNTEEIIKLLLELTDEQALPVVAMLPRHLAVAFIENVHDERIVTWLEQGDIEDASRISKRLSTERRSMLVDQVHNNSRRRTLKELLTIREGTVGELSDKEFSWVITSDTVAEVIDSVRRVLDEVLDPVLVLDDADHVKGFLHPMLLLRADQQQTVEHCIQLVPLLPSNTPVHAATSQPAWVSNTHLPVVDRLSHPIGILSRDSLVRASVETQSKAPTDSNLVVDVAQTMVHVFKETFIDMQNKKA